MPITKRKGKKGTSYRAEVYLDSVRVASKTFKTKSEAVLWEAQEKERLKNPQKIYRKEIEEMTVREVVSAFVEQRFPLMKRSTSQSYEDQLIYFQEQSFAKTKMNEFTSETVDRWLNWLLKHPTTKNGLRKSLIRELKLLITILNWYRNYLNADFNVPIVKRHRERCFYKKVPPRRPDYFIKPQEILSWVHELKVSQNPVYWKLAQFMLLTGARVGEACGLKWSEVDLENKFARVVRIASWDHRTKKPYISESTKTSESVRLLMLSDSLVKILKAMKEEAKSEIIFSDSKGQILKYNAIQTAFNKAFKKLGLSWRSTHICRHTYATMALMATRDLSAVQASLGHTDQKVTQRYAKALAVLSSETADKTEQIIGFDREIKKLN